MTIHINQGAISGARLITKTEVSFEDNYQIRLSRIIESHICAWTFSSESELTISQLKKFCSVNDEIFVLLADRID